MWLVVCKDILIVKHFCPKNFSLQSIVVVANNYPVELYVWHYLLLKYGATHYPEAHWHGMHDGKRSNSYFSVWVRMWNIHSLI